MSSSNPSPSRTPQDAPEAAGGGGGARRWTAISPAASPRVWRGLVLLGSHLEGFFDQSAPFPHSSVSSEMERKTS